MSEIPDVSGGETITSAGYNTRTDRIVQRYATEAARDASVLVPVSGDVAWVDDINRITVYDGSNWLVTVVDRGFFQAASGVAAGPSHTFDADTASGLFLLAASTVGVAAGGVEKVRVTDVRVGLIDPPVNAGAPNVVAIEDSPGVWNLYRNP